MKNTLKTISEIELIELAKDSNKSVSDKAFEEIYKRYSKAIRFYLHKKMGGTEAANADDKEDLLQVVFEKAFKSIHSFEPKYKLTTWLMRIAKNLVTDRFRKKSLNTVNNFHQDEDGNETTMDFVDNTYNPEVQAEKDQRVQFVHNLIDERLNGDYKKIIEMVFLEEKSYQEVADELEMPIGTVKAKIFRAKELLKDGLTKDLLLTA